MSVCWVGLLLYSLLQWGSAMSSGQESWIVNFLSVPQRHHFSGFIAFFVCAVCIYVLKWLHLCSVTDKGSWPRCQQVVLLLLPLRQASWGFCASLLVLSVFILSGASNACLFVCSMTHCIWPMLIITADWGSWGAEIEGSCLSDVWSPGTPCAGITMCVAECCVDVCVRVQWVWLVLCSGRGPRFQTFSWAHTRLCNSRTSLQIVQRHSDCLSFA